MKKVLAIFIVIVILLYSSVPLAVSAYGGTIPDQAGQPTSVSWNLDSFTNVLTIYGTGALRDFDSNGAHYTGWVNGVYLAPFIQTIYVQQGITRVGDEAFYSGFYRDGHTSNVKTIYIADTVTSLGEYSCRIPSGGEVYIFGRNVTFERFCFSEGTTIYGYAGSTAQSYAENNGLTFVALCEEHDTELKNYKESTCTGIGYSGDLICKVCGATLEKGVKTASLGHDYQLTNVSEPTCTETGYTGDSVCTRCGSVESTGQVIEALGHDWSGWSALSLPTCEENGEIIRFCSNCDEYETKNVPALGHDWGTVTYEWSADNSKCTATRICSRDVSHIETETVNTESHITKNADYENKGEVVFTAEFNNEAFEKQTKAIETPVLVWKGFPDVKNGDWYYDAVKYCATRGFITGYKNGNFGPADALQRQDFVVILARIAGADIDSYTSCKLTDVDMNAYYGKAVAWAVDQKIIGGYDNGKFGVGDKITREQVATILYRYMGSPDVDTSVLNKFPDKGSISSFAVNAFAWANTNDIINGKADGKLAPVATASRAEIAVIIMRMDQQGMFA